MVNAKDTIAVDLSQFVTYSNERRKKNEKGKGDDDAIDATSDEVNERTHVVSENESAANNNGSITVNIPYRHTPVQHGTVVQVATVQL